MAQSMTREEMNAALGMTESELDVYCEQFENDTWDASHLGEVTIGRPAIASEGMRSITVYLPVSQIEAIDNLAASKGTTRYEELAAAIDAWVAAS